MRVACPPLMYPCDFGISTRTYEELMARKYQYRGDIISVDQLRALENEADRLMLELYRDIYSGRLDPRQMFLLKEFFEILEKAIDRCREAGVVTYGIVLKNS